MSAGPEPVYFSKVDVREALSSFQDIVKVGGVYVVGLQAPLLVQTPGLTLMSPFEDEDGSSLPFVHLKLPQSFEAFAQQVENAILEACVANKETWIRRKMDDDALRASFKALCKGGSLKVKVPRDMLVFDHEGKLLSRGDVAPGTELRCLLGLDRICFGRTEFGGMWGIMQAQTKPPPPLPTCKIDPSIECEGVAEEAETSEFS